MMNKPKLVIAGPGAGKTYGLVNQIIDKLKTLSPSKYIVVITYTNSASDNIKQRLSKRIQIPPNLFIGTMHSFLNRFIVIPFSSFNNTKVNGEKLFIQCATDDIFQKLKKETGKTYNYKTANFIKKKIKDSMHKNGYITYDQTVSLAKECFENKKIKKIVANKIQYLFVDEFQDTGNNIFYIIDSIRKEKTTEIYCVGDPEQYIQSYDSSIKNFSNIPILKASCTTSYDVEINDSNFRCSEPIVSFLNHFNNREYGTNTFRQICKKETGTESVKFIDKFENVSNIIPSFFEICQQLGITHNDRCILAKKNEVIKRIVRALDGNIISPRKSNNISPIREIMATLLSALSLNQTEYLNRYNTTIFELRKNCIRILKAIKSGEITNENTFYKFISESLGLEVKTTVPFKLGNLRIHGSVSSTESSVVVSNFHNYKGLESKAVLVIAKTEDELLLWIETNQETRDAKRTNETTDYPRLGYVAFSRAKQLLCISCLEQISPETKEKLKSLDVELIID
ncbi:UvrD-helicase domain-containing protein [Aquimarina hainanensis]|uniref:UvrD-helicase domain-containing protein n=1 Tax=Aquimarina hainanensis TaxID=1578017 RepID=A0ABW5N8V6_9FLAO